MSAATRAVPAVPPAVPPAGALARIVGFELRDVVRSRWLLAYSGFFLLVTDALLRFGSGGGAQTLLSLLNVVLLLVPLVSLVFGTVWMYNAREFTELLLAQPIRRRTLFAGLWLGLTLPLAGGFVGGVAVPFLWRGLLGDVAVRGTLLLLLGCGAALTASFTAIAFLIAVRVEDRLRGLGLAIGSWLLLTVLYDGLVLVLVAMLADHPVERPTLGLILANPVDLARVLLLLRFDVAALMGYTGAVFQRFFGSGGGTALAATALLAWIAGPALFALRSFERKDF